MPRKSAEAIAQENTVAQQRLAVKRTLAVKKARLDLLEFTRLTMPDPADPEDTDKSRFTVEPHHRLIAEELMKLESGETKKLIIVVPPRHGKSELSSRRFLPWFVGRDPYRCVMLATYNQPFAEDFGRKVRDVMQSDAYAQIFPEAKLKKGSAASDRLETEDGGLMAFVGRGGSITGRGADLFVIDDPLKNREEADSDTERDKMWKWWNDDVLSRMMTDEASWALIQTRWHEDDLVGRLTDPQNRHYIEDEAKEIRVVHLAAVAKQYGAPEIDPLGREPGEVLWPTRFSREYFDKYRRRNPMGFSALYQGVPTPLDGDLFAREKVVDYIKAPDGLRIYAASDHAVTTKQSNDATVIVIVGVDSRDNIYILDVYWEREPPDVIVERMLDLAKKWRPLAWWSEEDHIRKAIGPFLNKRMMERRIYINLQKLSNAGKDKVQKAQPLVARVNMKMVHFPKMASWYGKALLEMMKFPNGTHDDFVDALANIFRGLDKMVSGVSDAPEISRGPKVGTLPWVKYAAEQERKANQRFQLVGGF